MLNDGINASTGLQSSCKVQRYMIRCEIIVAWQFYFDTDFSKNIT